MIREDELEQAIAECQGQRSPNANTCLKLASYYTIRDHMKRETQKAAEPQYSYDAPKRVTESKVGYLGESEFAEIIDGMDAGKAWSVMDELMEILATTHNRLYQGVLRKLQE